MRIIWIWKYEKKIRWKERTKQHRIKTRREYVGKLPWKVEFGELKAAAPVAPKPVPNWEETASWVYEWIYEWKNYGNEERKWDGEHWYGEHWSKSHTHPIRCRRRCTKTSCSCHEASSWRWIIFLKDFRYLPPNPVAPKPVVGFDPKPIINVWKWIFPLNKPEVAGAPKPDVAGAPKLDVAPNPELAPKPKMKGTCLRSKKKKKQPVVVAPKPVFVAAPKPESK